MTARGAYRETLRTLEDWEDYLLENSGLPGPRGNIELAQAVADEGSPALFRRYAAIDAETAPTNTPGEFLAFCGVLGLGRMLADGDRRILSTLRAHASDRRWRIREAVAMALQSFGEVDMGSLIAEMRIWATGPRLEQRAVAAALCEPRLLTTSQSTAATLEILETITTSVVAAEDRRTEPFKVLRQALGYCWSVAAAAAPDVGLRRMESWMTSDDPDIRWIMRHNLKKSRLVRVDAAWVSRWSEKLAKA